MNKGMLTVGIILLSVIALLLINVLTNFSTGSELDYYLVKETTDAAIEDSIDLNYLRNCGTYRMDKEKFVENFIFRFAKNVDGTRDYRLRFYDLNEVPPKVSVKIDSLTVLSVNSKGKNGAEKSKETADITTNYDAIVETTYYSDMAVEEGLHSEKSDYCKNLQ